MTRGSMVERMQGAYEKKSFGESELKNVNLVKCKMRTDQDGPVNYSVSSRAV